MTTKATRKTAEKVAGSECWNSRLGVILAVSGSAVGLGNFLRFPGQAAEYGGGAFMLAYFLALLLIGLPICWAEWTMGRRAGQAGYHSAPGVFHYFVRKPFGKYLGALGVVIPVIIYMYYLVIEAWCLGYAVNFLRGVLHFVNPEEAGSFFKTFVGIAENGRALGFGFEQVGPYLVIAFLLNFFLIYRGISKGIEWFCSLAMPTLFVLALIVLVRVLTLGTPDPAQPQNSVNNGLGFMWNPEKVLLEEKVEGQWQEREELVGALALASGEAKAQANPEQFRVRSIGIGTQLANPQLWMAAAGQVFFSLSVGFGVILTYASYLRRQDDVVLSGLTATSANEVCEVGLGGLITLPASVAFLGVGTVALMSSTFGLGFFVLPMVFSQMPFGWFFGFLFFFLLFLAAVTSSLSMLQPGIAFLEEALGVGRKISVSILSFITVVGMAFVVFFSADLKALDTLDFWGGTFLMFVMATIQIVVFGWVWGARQGLEEANRGSILQLPSGMVWIWKYVAPTFLLVIFALWVGIKVFGLRFDEAPAQLSDYVVDLFVRPHPVAWMSVILIGAVVGLVVGLIANAKRYRAWPPEDAVDSSAQPARRSV